MSDKWISCKILIKGLNKFLSPWPVRVEYMSPLKRQGCNLSDGSDARLRHKTENKPGWEVPNVDFQVQAYIHRMSHELVLVTIFFLPIAIVPIKSYLMNTNLYGNPCDIVKHINTGRKNKWQFWNTCWQSPVEKLCNSFLSFLVPTILKSDKNVSLIFHDVVIISPFYEKGLK